MTFWITCLQSLPLDRVENSGFRYRGTFQNLELDERRIQPMSYQDINALGHSVLPYAEIGGSTGLMDSRYRQRLLCRDASNSKLTYDNMNYEHAIRA